MSEPSPSPCPEWLPLLHSLADGELDAEHVRRVEEHLAHHPACAAEYAAIRATRALLADADLRWKAPPALRDRIVASIADPAAAVAPRPAAADPGWLHRLVEWVRPFSLPVSAAVLALSLTLTVLPRGEDASLASELVAGHVRSLLADHLTDIATSDRHQVKPWFNGKLTFSPPVIDLADQGFALKGGRVDYVGHRVVAALAFGHNGHVINVFIWPGSLAVPVAATRDGFALAGWSAGELVYWAVSDVSPDELASFRQDFAAAAGH